MMRSGLLTVLPYPKRFALVLGIGRVMRPLLPAFLQRKIPAKRQAQSIRPQTMYSRRMLVLEGCVQSLSAPNTNLAAARVLDKLGISLVSAAGAGCCGALNQHLSDVNGAHDMMRRNIDAWWPYIEQGVEAIVMSASGCGLMVKEYDAALKHDPDYAAKAARISELTRDLSEILGREDLSVLADAGKGVRVAYQSSCTLQHGQKMSGAVEAILQKCGYTVVPVANRHLCCGAAGTYTLTQPVLSQQLLENKLDALQQGGAEVIATANIGCQLHLESAARLPVKHWIELL
jgi:glycolate oxidase iron-sulfur subunit